MDHTRSSPQPDGTAASVLLQPDHTSLSSETALTVNANDHPSGRPLPPPQERTQPPLRLAVLGDQMQHAEILTFLERTAGIEIVYPTPKTSGQKLSRLSSKISPSLWSHTESFSQDTSPHVLLDLRSERLQHTHPEPIPSPNIDVIKRHAVELIRKLQKQDQGTQERMTQIEKLANIGTLASGILHDINNPLYVILGFSELLLDETLPQNVKEPLTEVVQATKRIMAMCQDLNLFARERLPQSCAPTHVVRQLEEALKVGKFASGLENIQIIRSYEADPMIHAKQEEVIQIFVNLIVNALQAMNGQGTLTLTVKETHDYVHLTIGDTGPGIPSELKERVFEPFFTTKPPGKGTGLGLHSVRLLVQTYGGHITLDSTVGIGTTFHLTFPSYGPSTPAH